MVAIPESLTGRIRTALAKAAPGRSGIAPVAWRSRRDQLLDAFDLSRHAEPSSDDVRAVIELLAESGPRHDIRLTDDEWSDFVDAVVSDVLGAS